MFLSYKGKPEKIRITKIKTPKYERQKTKKKETLTYQSCFLKENQ